MKRSFFALALIGVVLVAACGSAGSSAPLTATQLKNAAYTLPDAPKNPVQLKDGKATQEVAPGSASQYTAQMQDSPVANGDLNKDGTQDAANIVVTSGGGSGTFYNLCSVLNLNGKPGTGACVVLGDRIKVSTLAISNGKITVEYLDRAAGAPMASEPTQKVTKVYTLQNGALVESK